ncbi:MAG: DJ-1/PfpI family protein [Vulcanimicrobiaceae bacterium]
MSDSTIGILLFPDFQLLDVAGPLDVFATTPGLRPLLVAANKTALSPAGLPELRFAPQFDFDDAPRLDVLLVPGGDGIGPAIDDGRTLRFLSERGREAKFVTSVCTGSLLLGAAGLLEGYRAATHWRYMDLLALVGADPVDERIVRDRNRITSGGVTAGIDFGLVLAAELVGYDAAHTTQLWLQYSPEPPFSAGHPQTAPRAIVEAALAATSGRHAVRERLLRRT